MPDNEIIPHNNNALTTELKRDFTKEGLLWLIGMGVGAYQYAHPEAAQFGTALAMAGGSLATLNNIAFSAGRKRVEYLFGKVKEFLIIDDESEFNSIVTERPGIDSLLMNVAGKASAADSTEKIDIYSALFCKSLATESLSLLISDKCINTVSQLNDVQTHMLYRAIIEHNNSRNPFTFRELLDVFMQFQESLGVGRDYVNPSFLEIFIKEYLFAMKSDLISLYANESKTPFSKVFLDGVSSGLSTVLKIKVPEKEYDPLEDYTHYIFDGIHEGKKLNETFAHFSPLGLALCQLTKDYLK